MGIGLFLCVFTWTALGEKLSYHSPRPQFELELTAKDIHLSSSSHNLQIAITKCNRPMIDAFWAGAKAEVEKYPMVRHTPQYPFVDVDGKRRLILPGLFKNRLRYLPDEFITLFTLDRQQCEN